MGTNLESSNLKAEKTDNSQIQPEEHQSRWNQELEQARNVGFQAIERDHNLKQQGMLPTLELIAEPKRNTEMGGGFPPPDGAPERGEERTRDDSDSNRYADGTPKPGDPANREAGDLFHYADGTAKPGDPAQWKIQR
ncbi:hypothetical protein KBI23_06005 [bacterium]|nr:hypothetical protein [bacterium]MBP9809549.1 hypothetical protein [bacterium]